MKVLRKSSFFKALDSLRKGAVVIREGEYYYLIPGGRIELALAAKIKEHPQVMVGRDGMWPGHEQTWRIWPTEIA